MVVDTSCHVRDIRHTHVDPLVRFDACYSVPALFNGVNALSAVAPRSVAIVVAAAIAGVVFWEVRGGKVLGGGVIEYDPTAAPLLRDATLRSDRE